MAFRPTGNRVRNDSVQSVVTLSRPSSEPNSNILALTVGETQLRYSLDGTNPTVTNGHLLKVDFHGYIEVHPDHDVKVIGLAAGTVVHYTWGVDE